MGKAWMMFCLRREPGVSGQSRGLQGCSHTIHHPWGLSLDLTVSLELTLEEIPFLSWPRAQVTPVLSLVLIPLSVGCLKGKVTSFQGGYGGSSAMMH